MTAKLLTAESILSIPAPNNATDAEISRSQLKFVTARCKYRPRQRCYEAICDLTQLTNPFQRGGGARPLGTQRCKINRKDAHGVGVTKPDTSSGIRIHVGLEFVRS